MRSHAGAWERSEISRIDCACGRVRRAAGVAAFLQADSATAWVARPRSGASRHEKSTGRIARAVGCAVRTMFFHAIACETDHHSWPVPAGNIEEKCSVGGFCLVRTAHPTAGGAVLRGFAAYQHADFARMGCPAAVRLVPQRFENGRSGPRCCRLATVSGGPVVAGRAGCRRWYLLANPLRMVRRRFSPGSLPRRLKAFSLKKSAPVGEGGRSHRAGPGPILSRQADSR